jgi:hypothetical protein
LSPYKSYITKLAKKYTTDGVIDFDRIYNDLKSLRFGISESFDKKNNIVLRLLHSFFIGLPKSLIVNMWNIFKDIVIDSFKTRDWITGTLSSIATILVIVIIYTLSYFSYQTGEHVINGLNYGEVKYIKFEPAHYEKRVRLMHTGSGIHTYRSNYYIADRWIVYVVGENGREEKWVTYSPEIANNTKIGQTIENDDDWDWAGTNKTTTINNQKNESVENSVMSKIITKKQLNLVIENTLKEFKYNITGNPNDPNQLPEPPEELYIPQEDESCPECGGMVKEGLCEAGCGPDYMREADAKPDFLDLDKDGDKEEPMKKAAKEKDEVEESVEELTESLLKTTNNKLLKEEMNNFNKLINYKF